MCVFIFLLLVLSSASHAGTIGFSVVFQGDEVSVINKGSDAGYQLSLWTLDANTQWKKMQVIAGNTDYVAPAAVLNARRSAAVGPTAIGRLDPILVVLFDQAGSRIVQLAWHQNPTPFPSPFASRRAGSRLDISAPSPDVSAPAVVATLGIVVPYEGIGQLAQKFSQDMPPPDPVRHSWAAGSTMSLETGAGQMGAWFLHELADGTQQLQVVVDGKVRGAEQLPAWLPWLRQNTWILTGLLAGLGCVLVIAGCVGRRRALTTRSDLGS
jgi:hypothetical protein